MFTGIVEEVGTIVDARTEEAGPDGGHLRLSVRADLVLEDLKVGDSVSCSGCCLTVVSLTDQSFDVQLIQETLAVTAPRWMVGQRLNLERAMRADTRFGGHFVSGHVGGRGEVLAVDAQPGAYGVTVRAPDDFAPYLLPKGSITVDGVSLTVIDVGGPAGAFGHSPARGSDRAATDGSGRDHLSPSTFTLGLIPHTLEVTTLGELRAGDLVNLEADLLAKHVERLWALHALSRHGN